MRRGGDSKDRRCALVAVLCGPALCSSPDSHMSLNKLQLHPGHPCTSGAVSYKCKPPSDSFCEQRQVFIHGHCVPGCSFRGTEPMASHEVTRHLHDLEGGGGICGRTEKEVTNSCNTRRKLASQSWRSHYILITHFIFKKIKNKNIYIF